MEFKEIILAAKLQTNKKKKNTHVILTLWMILFSLSPVSIIFCWILAPVLNMKQI